MKVLLDGQGADEILMGYPIFFYVYFLELLTKFKVITFIKELLYFFKYQRKFPFPLIGFLFPSSIKRVFRRKKIVNKILTKKFKKRSIEIGKKINIHNPKLLSISQVDYLSLPLLLRFEDKNSMQWSIETRLPFCDYRFVEAIIKLPSNRKIKNGKTKFILREIFNKDIPNKIIQRTDKIGFEVPNDLIFCECFNQLLNEIFESSMLKNRPYWNYKEISKILNDNKQKMKYNSEILKFIILEKWFQIWIDPHN